MVPINWMISSCRLSTVCQLILKVIWNKSEKKIVTADKSSYQDGQRFFEKRLSRNAIGWCELVGNILDKVPPYLVAWWKGRYIHYNKFKWKPNFSCYGKFLFVLDNVNSTFILPLGFSVCPVFLHSFLVQFLSFFSLHVLHACSQIEFSWNLMYFMYFLKRIIFPDAFMRDPHFLQIPFHIGQPDSVSLIIK